MMFQRHSHRLILVPHPHLIGYLHSHPRHSLQMNCFLAQMTIHHLTIDAYYDADYDYT